MSNHPQDNHIPPGYVYISCGGGSKRNGSNTGSEGGRRKYKRRGGRGGQKGKTFYIQGCGGKRGVKTVHPQSNKW